jgi:hypothetical protein
MSEEVEQIAMISPVVLHTVELWNFLTLYLKYDPRDPELWQIIQEEDRFLRTVISEEEVTVLENFARSMQSSYVCGCGHLWAAHNPDGSCPLCEKETQQQQHTSYRYLR